MFHFEHLPNGLGIPKLVTSIQHKVPATNHKNGRVQLILENQRTSRQSVRIFLKTCLAFRWAKTVNIFFCATLDATDYPFASYKLKMVKKKIATPYCLLKTRKCLSRFMPLGMITSHVCYFNMFIARSLGKKIKMYFVID